MISHFLQPNEKFDGYFQNGEVYPLVNNQNLCITLVFSIYIPIRQCHRRPFQLNQAALPNVIVRYLSVNLSLRPRPALCGIVTISSVPRDC